MPLNPGGVEILAFIDRKRGVRLIETLGTHRTNWRLQRFEAGDPDRLLALEGMGFPSSACSWLQQRHEPSGQGPPTVDEVIAAMDREARRSDDGLAVLYSPTCARTAIRCA